MFEVMLVSRTNDLLLMRFSFSLPSRCWQWLPLWMCSLFLCRFDKVNVVRPLALFVVHAGAHLGTALRLAVGVLEAPVTDFEVASFGVLFLFVFITVKCFVVTLVVRIHPMSKMSRYALADMPI